MILERSMQPDWLSNAYLVGDEPGGTGVVIDSGAPSEPLLAAAERHGLEVALLLLTHHHHDHVAENHVWRDRHGVEILAHPLEAEHLLDVDRTIEPGETIKVGGLVIDPLHTPGHTAGMLSFLITAPGAAKRSPRHGGGPRGEDSPPPPGAPRGGRRAGGEVFTGDTLFKGSVGGVRAPGSTGFDDLRRSIMQELMRLPHDTRVHPGHTDPTTIGDEWERNPFVRLWRGLGEEGDEPCRVGDEPATLVLWAPDYDGGHKAWVRWPDGRDDIVPGSAVTRV